MIMKEYKYVEVKFEAKGVLFHSASEPKEIINKYAKEGYSYVGFIPTLIDVHGGFNWFDIWKIIFKSAGDTMGRY